jgi:Mg-chelatase subunit ChlD
MKLSSLTQRQFKSDRQGAMLPMVGVTLIILFVAVSFAVDIARMHLTRSELRTSTDAAARAAVETLSRAQNTQEAVDVALAIANRNTVAGQGLTLEAKNIVFGSASQGPDGKFTFSESTTNINSVRVVGERTSTAPDGPVTLFFGPMLGTDTFSPTASSTAVRLDRDIALVLDKSGSMSQNGRFAALQNGVDVFLSQMENSIPEERVSLTMYDAFPEKLVDMTDNMASIRNAFATKTPGGFTGIGRALEVGINSIQNDPGARGPFTLKSIVLMTDGNQNRGIDPISVAQAAKRQGIIIHTITLSNGANQTLMKEVADETGGRHVHATDGSELPAAFREIANAINVLTIQ